EQVRSYRGLLLVRHAEPEFGKVRGGWGRVVHYTWGTESLPPDWLPSDVYSPNRYPVHKQWRAFRYDAVPSDPQVVRQARDAVQAWRQVRREAERMRMQAFSRY